MVSLSPGILARRVKGKTLMTKLPTKMSAGIDYNYPLHGRYEYVLFADDETVVARASGFKSKKSAVAAGRRKADELLPQSAEA